MVIKTFYNFEKITESVGKKINFKLATNDSGLVAVGDL